MHGEIDIQKITLVTKYEYEYEYESCLLFLSLRRTSLHDTSLLYVKRLHSVTPYLPSRVTEKVGFSCY